MYVTFKSYPRSTYQAMSIDNNSYAFVKTDLVAQSDPNKIDPQKVVTHIFEKRARRVDNLDTVLRMIRARFKNTKLTLLNNLCITRKSYDAWKSLNEPTRFKEVAMNTLNQKDNISYEKVGFKAYEDFEKNAVAIIRRNEPDEAEVTYFAVAQVPVRAI